MTTVSTALTLSTSELPVVDGVYRTGPRRIAWVARTFPTLMFFLRLTWIVFRSASKAKWSTYDGRAWAESSLEVLRALESVGVEFEVTGREHLENVDGACLIVGNHMSTLETMILPCIVQPIRNVTFVVKQALVDYPVFKHVMRSRDPIAVSQSDPRGDLKLMLRGGLERLGKGISLVVFPNGQRRLHFDPGTFNSIGVKLASRADVPIVPVALRTDAWALGRIITDFGKIDPTKKVHFAFGPPLKVARRGVVENEAIIQFVGEHLRGWGVDVRSDAASV